MFSGAGIQNADGTEWYFPQRLTDDTGAVDNGNANPAQSVLDVDATMGHDLPTEPADLRLRRPPGRTGRARPPPQLLAQQSDIPTSNLTLVNDQSTYAHNDPAGAYPNNVFFDHLVPFLKKITAAETAAERPSSVAIGADQCHPPLTELRGGLSTHEGDEPVEWWCLRHRSGRAGRRACPRPGTRRAASLPLGPAISVASSSV